MKEETVVFVWWCPDCLGEYDYEGLFFLYADEDHVYCPCGGRLVEGVAPEGVRRYRLVILVRLRGTPLYRQLGELLAGEEGIETIFGRREDQHIDLSSCK
jgi:hypothetical protein